jgi:hypothetical protein
VHFYLDGIRSTDEDDHGDLVTRATDVVIGQAGEGTDGEYFTGLIDEVKVFGRALGHEEVLEIFRSTIHGGGHCENGADLTHCDLSSGDGSFDFCDAASAQEIMDLGAAHVTNGGNHQGSAIGTTGEVCGSELALVADGRSVGLARPGPGVAIWDGQAVSACIEVDWTREITSDGIKFSAASSDEMICGDESLSCIENDDDARGCGTAGNLLVFVSGNQRSGPDDFTTFRHQGTVRLTGDITGSGNGFDGVMNVDEMAFADGEQAVQYVALCRSGAGAGRDNLLIDYVALRASGRDYSQDGVHCDPRPPPPPPPLGEAFVATPVFSVNCFDPNSFDPSSGGATEWIDTAGSGATGSIQDEAAGHFVSDVLPHHFQFDGAQHFVFDHPEVFDFAADFSVSVLVRLPPNLEPYHVLLSRRGDSDYTSHHQIFIDTRSSWVGDWLVGEPVA